MFTDSRSKFDPSTNSLTKAGENLKVGDVVLRNLDTSGNVSAIAHHWKVVELVFTKLLGVEALKVGEFYGVYYRPMQVVLSFQLVRVDLITKTYTFQAQSAGVDNICVNVLDLPSVYPNGTGGKRTC